MTHYLLLLATLMVLAFAYSRKLAFTKFGQGSDGSLDVESNKQPARPDAT